MVYCFDTRIPKDWTYIQREKEITKKYQNGILYDGNTRQFLDFSKRNIDINGVIVFPRTGSIQIYEMNREIIRQGGIPILSNDEINQINDWPNYYCGNRKVGILKGKDLIAPEMIKKIKNEYGEEFFLKTKEKNFSGIIPITLLQDSECVFYKALLYHLEEEFIISEKMELIKDNYGTKEYRCFIRNHEVMNISRMTDIILHQIDKRVLDYANKVVKILSDCFMGEYVLDIVEKRVDNQIEMDIVEINPIHCSGLYLYNSMLEKSLDLLHKNIWNLPEEWEKNKEECILEGAMIENRRNLYECINSFSSDLRSIYLIGDRGVTFSSLKALGVKEFSRNVNILEEAEEITDDSGFLTSGTFEDCLSEEQKEKMKVLLKKYKSDSDDDLL